MNTHCSSTPTFNAPLSPTTHIVYGPMVASEFSHISQNEPQPFLSNVNDVLQNRNCSGYNNGNTPVRDYTPQSTLSESNSDFETLLLLAHYTGYALGNREPGDSVERGPHGLRPTESEAAVAETIVRARKSWKTVKGRSEPVWPPFLERTLVQALLQYKPQNSRRGRALERFPKRNRYISDFIFTTTGVKRTPKQVGSRLQQLKDINCGKILLNHVAKQLLSASCTASTPVNALCAPIVDHQPNGTCNIQSVTSGSANVPSDGAEGSHIPVGHLGSTGHDFVR